MYHSRTPPRRTRSPDCLGLPGTQRHLLTACLVVWVVVGLTHLSLILALWNSDTLTQSRRTVQEMTIWIETETPAITDTVVLVRQLLRDVSSANLTHTLSDVLASFTATNDDFDD